MYVFNRRQWGRTGAANSHRYAAGNSRRQNHSACSPSAGRSERTSAATSKPAAASATAVARPIPLFPPVTMATGMSSALPVARHYDALDELYRRVWGEHVHHGLWRTGKESPTEAVEQLVELVAAEAGIAIQHAVFGSFGSDGSAFMKADIPAAMVAFPSRYTHSAFETGNLDDIEALVEWLCAFVRHERAG